MSSYRHLCKTLKTLKTSPSEEALDAALESQRSILCREEEGWKHCFVALQMVVTQNLNGLFAGIRMKTATAVESRAMRSCGRRRRPRTF
jgi:hypothetical protein